MAKMTTVTMRLHPDFLEKLAAANASIKALQEVIRSDRVVQLITDPSEAD